MVTLLTLREGYAQSELLDLLRQALVYILTRSLQTETVAQITNSLKKVTDQVFSA